MVLGVLDQATVIQQVKELTNLLGNPVIHYSVQKTRQNAPA
jgi:hypothetical protein